MTHRAVALCRVSTLRQKLDGNSLEAQEKYVYECAEYHEARIEKIWSLDTSSKKGTNLARKDLQEIMEYCKRHKGVKYLILDEVDRFMRSVEEYYWWKVEFKRVGVFLAYAKMPEITHEDNPLAVMREMMEVFRAEASNHERITKTKDKMKARVSAGYYPFYPHQGYIRTDKADGLHIPDPNRFGLLQTALRAVSAFEMTPKQAVLWLWENGYTTPKGGKKLDLNRFTEILKDPYYAGILQVKDWPVNERGLHKAMITKQEYEMNYEIATGRKIRQKKKHNPLFPLNLAWHDSCLEYNGKITGVNHSNGKGWTRKQYMCRNCSKGIPSKQVHGSLSQKLDHLVEDERAPELFKEALKRVWEQNEAYRLEQAKSVRKRIEELEKKKSNQVGMLAVHIDLADEIKAEIMRLKAEIGELERQERELSSIDEEFEDFMYYSIDYVENLRKKWWSLPPERKNECKQLLFKDKIFVEDSGNVYTPDISIIYRLMNEKSDSKVAKITELVELPGIAPGSEK